MQRYQAECDKYSSKVNQIQAKWANLGLKSTPDVKILDALISSSQKSLEIVEKTYKQLHITQTEVARWEGNIEFTAIQKQIDNLCGTVEEDQFLNRLTIETQKLQTKEQEVTAKIETLDFFATTLAEELRGVDRRIKEIEPIWRSLLSRIVLDPRYSQTELDIKTKYNKPVASIGVPLHSGITSVATLASEAQITDLQLTFLMAMAQKQSWSPWRALLLDDPTQHHDLVHSSSVFDLLRDFIVEDNFQLVLTTHDKVQANFLKRKLENDGVPVTICQLQATEHGVISKELIY